MEFDTSLRLQSRRHPLGASTLILAAGELSTLKTFISYKDTWLLKLALFFFISMLFSFNSVCFFETVRAQMRGVGKIVLLKSEKT